MSPAHLRLRLLGPFTVEGELSAPVPTGKARRALAVLARRRGEFVPVAALIDALWDGEPPERADRNVAALISRLRRAVGRERIDGTAAGYRLVSDELAVDLVEATELLDTAEFELAHGRLAPASTSAEQAVKMLEADTALAGEHADPWVQDVRRSVARLLRRARVCWSAAALELRVHDTAVEVASAVVHEDPFDEQACRTVMLAHQRAGRSGAALLAYKALRAAMTEQLGTSPSPATQAVFLAVLRAEGGRAGNRARRPAPTPEPAAPCPVVGRDPELATLRGWWTAAITGSPVLAVLTGEAGIGKSALVGAFAEEPARTGALVLTVGCFEAERSLYLQPLVEAVRTVVHRMAPADLRELAGSRLGTLAALVPELVTAWSGARIDPALAPGSYERAGPELEHRRSLDALAGFFVRLSARQPVLLVVEDAQHAGQSTIEALHLLAGHWAGSRIMVVVTERTGEDDRVTAPLRDVAAFVDLGPLSAGDVAELVRRAGRDSDPEQLYAWTGGSPLFLTELLRQPAPGPGVAVPRSLTDAVAERLAGVGERTARVLAQGAVLGVAFSLDEVAALSDLDAEECARCAGRALRAGLLVEQGESFRFANDIVRRVAYDTVPAPVRISRHRRAARLLEARPEAAARHLAAAHDWDGAVRAYSTAAHAAHLAFAGVETEQLLGQAVEAARTAGAPARLADVLLRRGQARSDLGHHDDARADHEEALGIARELGDAELEARVLEQLGWTALYARDALGAVDLAEQATELAESAAAAPGALPTASLLLGRVRHWDGDYAGAGAAYEQVLTAGAAGNENESTTALALAYRGALLQHQDRFAEAKATLARAAVLCRRTGQFRPLLQTLFFTGLARGDTGDFSGALRALDNARRLIDADGVGFYRAGIETTTSWMWQELGQIGRAREHAEHAVELAHRGGGALELEQELHALLAVADCDLLLGKPDAAAAAVEAAAPMLERSLPFKPRAAMRLLEMRSRWEPDRAEALLDEARTYSSSKYAALALRRLGRAEDAARLAAETGSDLLVAQLGARADRTSAVGRIADSLPTDLRASFLAAGRLTR